MLDDIVAIKIEKIIKTKRKTISIEITNEGKLIIKAPLKVSNEFIKATVLKYKEWIEQKKNEIKFYPKKFVNGENFLYLGKNYSLHIVESKSQNVPLKFDNGFFLTKDALPYAKELFIQWYKNAAFEVISKRVALYAAKYNFNYNRIKITNAQKRWGACSGKNLNFPWRLIMAPLYVVDYVVVHELVHLEEKNHQKVFWDKVKRIMPDYKIHIDWLKKNGYMLNLG